MFASWVSAAYHSLCLCFIYVTSNQHSKLAKMFPVLYKPGSKCNLAAWMVGSTAWWECLNALNASAWAWSSLRWFCFHTTYDCTSGSLVDLTVVLGARWGQVWSALRWGREGNEVCPGFPSWSLFLQFSQGSGQGWGPWKRPFFILGWNTRTWWLPPAPLSSVWSPAYFLSCIFLLSPLHCGSPN